MGKPHQSVEEICCEKVDSGGNPGSLQIWGEESVLEIGTGTAKSFATCGGGEGVDGDLMQEGFEAEVGPEEWGWWRG